METIWFCIVAVMLAAYVLLDGFDLGAGVIHLLAARTEDERRTVISSIGPVWDGNEVWLLAAGGTLYFAFPGLYAAGFSGFYLALMIVLWLLMLRGISIEFRGQIDNSMWKGFWDVVFCGASVLLAIFYGAALGNVVRGVPLNSDGFFFIPFWTTFTVGASPGIIDWYTVSIGVAALAVLTLHGALWIALKGRGALESRALAIASWVHWAVCVIVIAISVVSFYVQPRLGEAFGARPYLWVLPVVATAGLLGVRLCLSVKLPGAAFLSSCAFIVGLLCSAAFGLYPNVLPSTGARGLDLTIHNVAAPTYGLQVGLMWWTPAFLLAIGYTVFSYRHFRGKLGPGAQREAGADALEPTRAA